MRRREARGGGFTWHTSDPPRSTAQGTALTPSPRARQCSPHFFLSPPPRTPQARILPDPPHILQILHRPPVIPTAVDRFRGGLVGLQSFLRFRLALFHSRSLTHTFRLRADGCLVLSRVFVYE